MKIVKEGTITITKDSRIVVEGFDVTEAQPSDLLDLAVARIRLALRRAEEEGR